VILSLRLLYWQVIVVAPAHPMGLQLEILILVYALGKLIYITVPLGMGEKVPNRTIWKSYDVI
jgi:hypothetical protein